ncbi:MAG: hypothetical protein PHP08_00730 [Candidatus Dojkabacteria bacterium]|nr:hypothetical protein [Candidatus Dojkabacteria bacterium]
MKRIEGDINEMDEIFKVNIPKRDDKKVINININVENEDVNINIEQKKKDKNQARLFDY